MSRRRTRISSKDRQRVLRALRRRDGCTGTAAAWCPVHGDCTCDRAAGDLGWGPAADDPANVCPLHSHGSPHEEGAVWCPGLPGRPCGVALGDGDGESPPTVDHIHEWADGGSNHLENLRLLCEPCNQFKSNPPGSHLRPDHMGFDPAWAEPYSDPMDEGRRTKQVIVMRKDLGMRKGKMVAQGAHASIAWLTNRLDPAGPGRYYSAELSESEQAWIDGSFVKVCVYVESLDELVAVHKAAREAGLVSRFIIDAGLTEFGGVPTPTCCGIGPDWAERIDPVTGHLPLL